MSHPLEKPDTSSDQSYEQDQSTMVTGRATAVDASSDTETNGHAHCAETRSQFWGVPNNVLHDYYDTK